MFIRNFIINFFTWWYMVHCQDMAKLLLHRFMFVLQATNTLPMAQNLGRPLYQDDTAIGRSIGLVVRGLWVWFGGIASILAVLPFTLVFAFNILLPVVGMIMLFVSLVAVLL